jgi:hypothetical protein
MTCLLNAQCDSTSEAGQVFAALNIDESLPFLRNTPLYLELYLDKKSIAIIREGIARRHYVRQRNESGRIVFDTVEITDRERKELDSLVSKLSRTWTNPRLLACGINRNVEIYRKGSEAQSGVNRVTHQIMEPIFLRNRTLAFAFYKRSGFDKHAEFTLFIKKSEKWELWNKIIILEEW